jgi:hypothetical protein
MKLAKTKEKGESREAKLDDRSFQCNGWLQRDEEVWMQRDA